MQVAVAYFFIRGIFAISRLLALLRDVVLAWYMISSCVRMFVCLSVCHTLVLCLNSLIDHTCNSSIDDRAISIMQIMPHDSPGDSSFLLPKISAKFEWSHPQYGAKFRLGRLKFAT